MTGSHPTRDSVSPEVLKEEPKQVLKEEPKGRARASRSCSSKRSRGKPETEYPEGFAPLDRHVDFASKHGLDLELELTKFRGNHVSKGHMFKNWHMALDTWLAGSVGYAKRDASKPGFRKTAEPQRGTADGIVADESGFDDSSKPPAKVIPLARGASR